MLSSCPHARAARSLGLACLLIAAASRGAAQIDPNDPPPPYHTPSNRNVAIVVPKPAGAGLVLPPGFEIAEWASDLNGPRTMAFAPNGDLFVAETFGGRVTVFRNPLQGSGERSTFLSGVSTPFGLDFRDGYLYVGIENAVRRYAYRDGQTEAEGSGEVVVPLPPGGHTTRNVLFSPDGSKMYIAIGSAGNLDVEPEPRATIQEANPDGSGLRTFASGLRNPTGMDFNPNTGKLWTVVNERDGYGDDTPPDYATSVSDGDYYGWPFAYLDGRPDPIFAAHGPDRVAMTRKPDIPIQAHSAPLGIAFYTGTVFPEPYRGDAFIALHGSWNRAQKTGYKVIRVDFEGGEPVGPPEDFVTGWLHNGDVVWGRPVGVASAPDGSLFISDDGAGKIWRVVYNPSTPGGLGDVTEDGQVNVEDVLALLRSVAGIVSLSPTQAAAADVYPVGAPDQVVTILDVVTLLRRVAGLEG